MHNASIPVAILQGRLSPDTESRYQFFPKALWQDEFHRAREIGFDGIEWLVDPKGWRENPIFSASFSEAENLSRDVLPIVSVCADWFMEVCIWEGNPEEHRENIRKLFPHVVHTKNKLILLPLLETHPIKDVSAQEKVIAVLKPLSTELETLGITIAFETELTASELATFLDSFESPAFGVYYDVGNCTSYGFNCADDVRVLGNRIKGVHLKDRKIGTTKPLRLGEGDADFAGVIGTLLEIGWPGTLVMQAWRGERYIDDAKTQLEFIRSFFKTA
jgi:sugar phosphate isomerase/epimerase